MALKSPRTDRSERRKLETVNLKTFNFLSSPSKKKKEFPKQSKALELLRRIEDVELRLSLKSNVWLPCGFTKNCTCDRIPRNR